MDFVERRKDARFQPRQSGKPARKEPGTRNRATALIKEMMGDEGERVAHVAIGAEATA